MCLLGRQFLVFSLVGAVNEDEGAASRLRLDDGLQPFDGTLEPCGIDLSQRGVGVLHRLDARHALAVLALVAVHVVDDTCRAGVLHLVFAASRPAVVPRHVAAGILDDLEGILGDGLVGDHGRGHLLHRLGGKLRRDAVFLEGFLQPVEILLGLVHVLLLHLLLDRCDAALSCRATDSFRKPVVGIGEVDDLAFLVDQAGQVLSVLVDDGLLRRLVVVGAFLGALEFAEEQVKFALLLDVLAADLVGGLHVLLHRLGVLVGL